MNFSKEDALNLPCLNILSEVNSPIIFIETKMLKSVQKDFVSINLIGWCPNVIVWLELNSLQGGTKCDVAIFCGEFWCNFLQQKPAQKFCLITLITMMCLSSILVLNAPVAPDLKLLTSIVQIKDFPFYCTDKEYLNVLLQ